MWPGRSAARRRGASKAHESTQVPLRVQMQSLGVSATYRVQRSISTHPAAARRVPCEHRSLAGAESPCKPKLHKGQSSPELQPDPRRRLTTADLSDVARSKSHELARAYE